MVTVAKAFIEITLGECRLAADRANGQRRSRFLAEQLNAGGDEGVAAYGVAIFQRDARPATPSLTRLHIPPRIK
ncbi:hypothetical protein NJB18091_40400 [Mycobacterium marinum]|uniref:Uncharacterized protein n=1 Tax=Mycobacterium pseudoshottsii TaxID=265949 RepID=A0A9N7QN49_9MYCO|nr:hypothetical protein NJB1907Z4_C49880 [Mycobacterium pseudoshottsii]GJO03730.1 hypothetical protein NJB18091_40400 [Mycobacterium marinum]GJO18930.1 hypothetical protein NJB1507_11450 [Mycobacterium marinum]